MKTWLCDTFGWLCESHHHAHSGSYAPEISTDHIGAVLVTTLLAMLLVTSYRRPKH